MPLASPRSRDKASKGRRKVATALHAAHARETRRARGETVTRETRRAATMADADATMGDAPPSSRLMITKMVLENFKS